MSELEVQDDDIDLVEDELEDLDGRDPIGAAEAVAARTVPARLERKELTSRELDLLDLAVIVALDMVPEDERRATGEDIVRLSTGLKVERHVILLRSVISVGKQWAAGESGAREVIGLRNSIAGHFRSRYARRNREASS